MEALHVSTDPEKEFKKLINDLFTECMRCHTELRVRDINSKTSLVLCQKCRCVPTAA